MKLNRKFAGPALAVASLFMASAVFAAEQTVNLSVPGMTCASCPYIVESAINQVDGVRSVETSLAEKTALVVYDDTVATIQAITDSTYLAGYESSVIPAENG